MVQQGRETKIQIATNVASSESDGEERPERERAGKAQRQGGLSPRNERSKRSERAERVSTATAGSERGAGALAEHRHTTP